MDRTVALAERTNGWVVSAEDMVVVALKDGEATLDHTHYTWTGLTVTWGTLAERKPTRPCLVLRLPDGEEADVPLSKAVAAKISAAEASAAAASADSERWKAAALKEAHSRANERWKTVGLCATFLTTIVAAYIASLVPGLQFELETAASLLEQARCPGQGEGLAVRVGHCTSELTSLRELETALRSTIKGYEKRDHDANVIAGQIAGLDEPMASDDGPPPTGKGGQ